MFASTSYNELFVIGILEVLMNLILYHGFTKGNKSTVILLCRSRLVNYYLAKGLVILQYNYKHLSSIPIETKQKIHAICIQKTDFVMAFYTAISKTV